MLQISLIKPSLEHQEKVVQFKNNFFQNGEFIPGGAGLDDLDFDAWIDRVNRNANIVTCDKRLVPCSTFLAFNEEEQLIGVIDIRHYLNIPLRKVGGHIGYSVIKNARKKGYATLMLAKALEECHKLGLSEVLLTCDRLNLASKRVIEKNGGILDLDPEFNDKTLRYWIKIKR